MANACTTLAGSDHLHHWLRHYATARFKITSNAVDDFLGGLSASGDATAA